MNMWRFYCQRGLFPVSNLLKALIYRYIQYFGTLIKQRCCSNREVLAHCCSQKTDQLWTLKSTTMEESTAFFYRPQISFHLASLWTSHSRKAIRPLSLLTHCPTVQHRFEEKQTSHQAQMFSFCLKFPRAVMQCTLLHRSPSSCFQIWRWKIDTPCISSFVSLTQISLWEWHGPEIQEIKDWKNLLWQITTKVFFLFFITFF